MTPARVMMLFEANKKSPFIAYLLLILLGSLGAHNFYLKRTSVAIAQIILTLTLVVLMRSPAGAGVTVVWTIVDAFLIPSWINRQNTLLAAELGAGWESWMATTPRPPAVSQLTWRAFRSELWTLQGRANRARYWLTVAVMLAIWLALNLVVRGIFELTLVLAPSRAEVDQLVRTHELLFVVLFLAPFAVASFLCFVPIILAGLRRLHDRDKSAHWGWLFFCAPLVLEAAGGFLLSQEQVAAYLPVAAHPMALPVAALLLTAALAITIWGFIEVGCLPGTAGPNRFGPDPLKGSPPP
jgi:uncharacterized membrane protein YhaH (DUF805 family)/TM2 domain-containing membrane protein YozV